MTDKELSKYYWLKKEVEDLQERIITYGVGVGSVQAKDLNVESTPKLESLQERIVQLKDLWIEKRIAALEEYIKIECYINHIEDAEIRLIARYRYLDCKNWNEIGDLMNYDRTAVSKKLRGYLNFKNMLGVKDE